MLSLQRSTGSRTMVWSKPSLATLSQSQGETSLLNSRTADFSTAVLMDGFADSKAGHFYVVIYFVFSSHQEGLEANHAFPPGSHSVALEMDTCSPWTLSECSRVGGCSFWMYLHLANVSFIHQQMQGAWNTPRNCSNRVSGKYLPGFTQ